MPPKKYALKGEPDFHTISDERLKGFLDLAQQMIFAYKYHDKDKTKVLEEIWHDLSCEHVDRVAASAIEELSKQEESVATVKKVPKLRRSPVNRRI